MAKKKKEGSPEDIAEFGDGELAGDPTIGRLIEVLPKDKQDAYRNERRAFVQSQNILLGRQYKTYREYLENEGIGAEKYRPHKD